MDREWTDKRTDDLADRVGRFEGSVDARFDKVDERFNKVDERFDKVDARFDKVDFKIATVDSKMDKLSRRVTSGLVTVVAAVIIKVFLS